MGNNAADSVRKAVVVSGVALGAVAVAAPGAFVSTYGLRATPATKIMTRLWGSRSLALGALTLGITDAASRRTLTTVSAALGVGDAALILAAGEVAASSRVRGALTAAAFVAAHSYLLSQD
ncbi:DUF4267 domain-containing protein [uncultured Jatrophihabitans sp.]|uniref:DUF4267 domain-containing protein n=1 Tax=uncultured Jatrophihabitans sp. TaxID=1610747 RepID=UPI0035C9E9E5